MSVPRVTPGMIVASTHKADQPSTIRPEGHNQRRAVLKIGDHEVYAGYGKPLKKVRKAQLSGGGAAGGQTTWVKIREDGSLPGYRLVSEPDPMIDALANCFSGITTRQRWSDAPDAEDYFIEHDVVQLVRRSLLAQRGPNNQPRRKEDVSLDQDAILAIAQRLLTLSQVAEQNALVSGLPLEAGYAPAQPALAAVEELSAKVDDILAKMPAAEWGDGE